jgi:cytochrome c551/c552
MKTELQKMGREPIRCAKRWLNCPVARSGFFLLAGAVLLVSRLHAGVVKIELPLETGVFKPAPGSLLANAQCLTCHSVDYAIMQPPLPLKAWTAEVEKMRKTFGAPIPEDQIAPLAKYLAENYGTDTNHPPAAEPETTAQTVSSAGQMVSAETLATRYGCLNCHQVDTKVVGPAFRDVRAKYLHDPDAIEKIVHQIHNGGSGKWGSAIMPPFSAINDAESKKLAAWIMIQDGSK